MANIRAKHNTTPPTVANDQWADLQVDASGRLIVSSVSGGSNEATIELLEDGDTTGAGKAWTGGNGIFFVNGTWDGATAALEWSADNSTWIGFGSTYALTTDGGVAFALPSGYVRAAISSAGTTSLSAYAKKV